MFANRRSILDTNNTDQQEVDAAKATMDDNQ